MSRREDEKEAKREEESREVLSAADVGTRRVILENIEVWILEMGDRLTAEQADNLRATVEVGVNVGENIPPREF